MIHHICAGNKQSEAIASRKYQEEPSGTRGIETAPVIKEGPHIRYQAEDEVFSNGEALCLA